MGLNVTPLIFSHLEFQPGFRPRIHNDMIKTIAVGVQKIKSLQDNSERHKKFKEIRFWSCHCEYQAQNRVGIQKD